MPPPSYLGDLRQAVKRNDGTDIFYPISSKLKDPIAGEFIPDVRFAIVIQRTNFDIQPAMPLKF